MSGKKGSGKKGSGKEIPVKEIKANGEIVTMTRKEARQWRKSIKTKIGR